MELRGLVVMGTSGHARSCLDVLASIAQPVLGCVGEPPNGELQVDYLGGDSVLTDLWASGVTDAVVAVGDNETRRRLVHELDARGFRLPTIVSAHSVVSPTASVGSATVIMHGVVVGPYSSIGIGAIVNTGASVDHDCVVGDFVHVAPGSHLAGSVTVGSGAFLGVGASVVPGTVIGDWSTVGAGAVVIAEVACRKTVAGVPARELLGS